MGEVTGYEIRVGETERGELSEAFYGDGAATPDGLVFGTYMHGLFQNPGAVNALLSYLSQQRGVPFEPWRQPMTRPPMTVWPGTSKSTWIWMRSWPISRTVEEISGVPGKRPIRRGREKK